MKERRRRSTFLILFFIPAAFAAPSRVPADDLEKDYGQRIRPILARHCLACHSTEKKKGDLDLERFSSLEKIRGDLRPWSLVLENVESGEMPPKKSPPPSAQDRRAVAQWVREMLQAAARAQAGDPGRVVVRRLSNSEYNNSIRDLTGIDLEPARDFPLDGAAGEGFTNAGDALVTSPTLLGKYLAAAKEVSAHCVLLPDGFRFSPSKTQRDWTDEALAELRRFFAAYTKDGRLPLRPYLAATLKHRQEVLSGKTTWEAVAQQEKLLPKYLGLLGAALGDPEPSFPLDRLRSRWRAGSSRDLDPILTEIAAWQEALWKSVKIGSYAGGKTLREEPVQPTFAPAASIKIQPRPVPGSSEVVLYLSASEFSLGRTGDSVLWRQPRFLMDRQPPLLLRDYAKFGARYEVEFAGAYSDLPECLAAVRELAKDPTSSLEGLAKKHGVNPVWLGRWVDLSGLCPPVGGQGHWDPSRMPEAMALERLEMPAPRNEKLPAIRGWKSRGGDLPMALSNSGDREEHLPGRAAPHQVVIHPSSEKFAGVSWKSPIDGRLRIAARIAHLLGCGHGTQWRLEARRRDRALPLGEGLLGGNQEKVVPPQELKVEKGDLILLAVDSRDGDHGCDLTEVNLTLSEVGGESRTWDLARETADTLEQGNPHPDRFGHPDAWEFVEGKIPTGKRTAPPSLKVPPDSLLGKWKAAASDPARASELEPLAKGLVSLLSGRRPEGEKNPDRILFDSLSSVDSPLFAGLDFQIFSRPPPGKRFGLEASRFGDAGDVSVPAQTVLEFRLPAALFREYEFAVEGELGAGSQDRVAQFHVQTTPPPSLGVLDPQRPCVTPGKGQEAERLLRGLDEFRRLFPRFLCYPRIVPDDEGVCLKLYHREDEALTRLFLSEPEARRLDRLWEEHRWISQWPITESKNLPMFIGFVTQEGTKEIVAYFEGLREPFGKRAQAFERDLGEAEPRQLEALLRFAARACRRPLTREEEKGYRELYGGLRKKAMPHADSLRAVLVRILVAPSFLFRLDESAAGPAPRAVSDWELSTRLSYFLWASLPDEELEREAASGRLRDPLRLEAQVERMMGDPRMRGLAVEFATQWLHVRGFRQNHEKNEKLFPTFNQTLRDALFEETVLFFQDLFQSRRRIDDLIGADYSFLNETLAQHYGIPGIAGKEWRRVDGVGKYGRGGILALGSVLAQQAGASRTSPVLRGNWVVETLLGERLPRPPANVPRLPEEESAAEGTVREMVARHTRVPECAVCHVRIDPFGFALERYDPLGRKRDQDLGGRPVDVSVRLRDGTEFSGIEGLRAYLLGRRRKDLERTFSQKLLGYALGRSVILSDQPLLEEMVESLEKGGSLSGAILAIVRRRQFQYHRGLEATRDE